MSQSPSLPFSPEFQQQVAASLLKKFGGLRGFQAYLLDRTADFEAVWDQDSTELGQILHAHLVVDYFLLKILEKLHPGFPFAKMQLRWEQKVDLLPDDFPALGELKPGLRVLGKLRNRMAHVHRVAMTKDDLQPILKLKSYEHGRASSHDIHGLTPIEVYKDFAKWAAQCFHTGLDPMHELFETWERQKSIAAKAAK